MSHDRAERLGGEPDLEFFDSPPIGPIDDGDDQPPSKPPPWKRAVEELLRKLKFAPPMKDTPDAEDYRTVVEALDRKQLSVDEANKVGCAWAWRAYLEEEDAYWSRAVEALRKAIAAAKGDSERRVPEANLKRVLKAWGLMAAAN